MADQTGAMSSKPVWLSQRIVKALWFHYVFQCIRKGTLVQMCSLNGLVEPQRSLASETIPSYVIGSEKLIIGNEWNSGALWLEQSLVSIGTIMQVMLSPYFWGGLTLSCCTEQAQERLGLIIWGSISLRIRPNGIIVWKWLSTEGRVRGKHW